MTRRESKRKRPDEKEKRDVDPVREKNTESEAVSGDDCEVCGDEDCDDIRYDDEEDDRDEVNETEHRNRLGVDEQVCEDFVAEFGEAARDDEDVSDADSGDEIWDDERIPDPLSDSDNDEDLVDGVARTEPEDLEELLKLGKTFSCPEDFKIAVLRYSLKTRYDIKLYRSQTLKIGAKCLDTDVKCQWRCYCSYDRKKHKMQIKVYESKHICVRSGYFKMLKRRTIAWLFSDRLRKNPKITKHEMVDEIKREYNLVVSDEQCSKAKTKIMKERRAVHEDHFSRIWDYQAEVLRTNPGLSLR